MCIRDRLLPFRQFLLNIGQRQQLFFHLLHVQKGGVVGIKFRQGVSGLVSLGKILIIVEVPLVAGHPVKAAQIQGVGALLIGCLLYTSRCV